MDIGIKTSNITIAKFMGAVESDFGDYMVFTKDNPRGSGKINHSEILYHQSWDWLMPVIEKIGVFEYPLDREPVHLRTFGMKDADGNYMVRFNRCILHSDPSFIKAAYNAVLDAIDVIKHEMIMSS